LPQHHDGSSPAPCNTNVIPFPPPPRAQPPAPPPAPELVALPVATIALTGALRDAVAQLNGQCAALSRAAQALAVDKTGFLAAKRRLLFEGRRAQAIAAQADRIAIAIAAGDLDALAVLQDELRALAQARAEVADQPADESPTSAKNCVP
jgi:hypothetical protein